MGRALMFQGTGSDVGKSLIVAGLARTGAGLDDEGGVDTAPDQLAAHLERHIDLDRRLLSHAA